jgi:hypothetical protein
MKEKVIGYSLYTFECISQFRIDNKVLSTFYITLVWWVTRSVSFSWENSVILPKQ